MIQSFAPNTTNCSKYFLNEGEFLKKGPKQGREEKIILTKKKFITAIQKEIRTNTLRSNGYSITYNLKVTLNILVISTQNSINTQTIIIYVR